MNTYTQTILPTAMICAVITSEDKERTRKRIADQDAFAKAMRKAEPVLVRTDWPSAVEAIHEWALNRVDGYGIPGTCDTTKIERHIDEGGFQPPRYGSGGTTVIADRLAIVDLVIDLATRQSTPPSETSNRVLAAFASRIVGKKKLEDIAERLEWSADECKRILNRVMRDIEKDLSNRGMVPAPKYDYSQEYPTDLFGWEAIAAHMKVSLSTARRWKKRLGMPVRKTEEIEANRKELSAWLANLMG